MAKFEWVADDIARLLALWATGLSARQIACDLGVSRNAVIGKIHRLKLAGQAQGRLSPLSGVRPPRPKAPPRERKARSVVRRARVIDRPLAPLSALTCETLLIDLEANQCRYPGAQTAKGTYLFCGRPSGHGHVYCLEHHAICCTTAHAPSPRPVLRLVHPDAMREFA